jgi:hypothetical protein
MPEEKLIEEEAKLSDELEKAEYAEKLAAVKAELEQSKLAEQLENVMELAQEERPDPEQIFSGPQIKFMRNEISKTVTALAHGMVQRKESSIAVDYSTEAMPREDSRSVELASNILGLIRVAEERLDPVLVPRSQPDPPIGAHSLMDVLEFIHSYLSEVIDRIQT